MSEVAVRPGSLLAYNLNQLRRRAVTIGLKARALHERIEDDFGSCNLGDDAVAVRVACERLLASLDGIIIGERGP